MIKILLQYRFDICNNNNVEYVINTWLTGCHYQNGIKTDCRPANTRYGDVSTTVLMIDKFHYLTSHIFFENAEYTLGPPPNHWKAWIWKSIVLLSVSGTWPAEQYPHYFSEFWDIFCERKKSWDKVYFLFDTSNLPIQSEEFRSYLWENWAHLLDREDFCLCIIESSSIKRTVWKAIYRLLKVEGKIHLFRDNTSAFHWIQEMRPFANRESDTARSIVAIPEQLNVEWLAKHAHIKLVGKDQLWSITACRNIILLKIQKHWTAENIKEYIERISGLPSLLLEKWSRIFLIFDVSDMDFAIRDAPRFLQRDLLAFLDRDDMTTCAVHKKKLSRLLWRQLLSQIGKLDKVKVFPNSDAALTWIRRKIVTCAKDSM